MDNNKVTMFCANDQVETEHDLDVDGNGEVVLTCPCGRFIKMPANTTPETLTVAIEKQKESNEGQITQESIEQKKQELLDAINNEELVEEENVSEIEDSE